MKPVQSRTLMALTALLPSLAMAHPGHMDGGHAFMSGLLHPIGGLDHLLAMVAVGLWAALLSARFKNAVWAVPTSFVALMVVGFFFGLQSGSIAMTEQAIAASVLVIGLAAAWAKQVPVALASVIAAAFAFFHGVAHGAEMSGGAAGVFAAGFVLSTIALHLVGLAFGRALSKNTLLTRTAGTAIGLAGLSFFFI